MLGIDPRAARYTWTAALVLLLLGLIYQVRTTLFVFILALLLAYLLSPLVDVLDRGLPSRTRTPALALAYLIFVGILALIGSQIGQQAVEQANSLGQKLPQMLQSLQSPAPAPGTVTSLKDQFISRVRSEIATRSNDLLASLPRAGLKALAVASDLIYVVIIPILAFFFLKDAHAIRQHILDMVEPGPRRAILDDLLADVHLLLAHYMRALVLLSLATFTAYAIFFAIVGVPYAVLLATMGAMLEFIPMLGPLTAGITILIVTGVGGGPVVGVLIFLLAYRLFQDYILSPHLMGQGVELHPLLVLFGVFAGAELAGIPGTFLSVPVIALVRIIYLRIRKSRLGLSVAPPTPVRL
jgi:predicted PurR-regulated permease PerM